MLIAYMIAFTGFIFSFTMYWLNKKQTFKILYMFFVLILVLTLTNHLGILSQNKMLIKSYKNEQLTLEKFKQLELYSIDKSLYKPINPRIMDYNVNVLILQDQNKNLFLLDICIPDSVNNLKLIKYL